MKKNRVLISFCLVVFVFPLGVLAHPGNTDSSGCHTCRTNCSKWGLSTGEYHCHRAKSLPQPIEPVKSKFSETGGVTVPAPEYKQPVVKPVTKEVKPIVKPTTKEIKQVVKPAVKEVKPTTKEIKKATKEVKPTIVNNEPKVESVNKDILDKPVKKESNSWVSKLFKSIFNR